MKLLFDENLSYKLARELSAEFPQSEHVRDVELSGADDQKIWEFAKAGGFIIISKDSDFQERSVLEGFPPKVIWLQIGNAGTGAVCKLLRSELQRVAAFIEDTETSFLVLPSKPISIDS